MKSAKTIDEKHTEIVSQFAKNQTEIIPKLKEEIEQLKTKLKKVKKNIDEYMDTKDAISKKQHEIKVLNSQEKNYYLENSKYIFDYFEQKKGICSGGNGGNVNVLHSFFKIKADKSR
jgi:predicted RNase H-like nuclease (RuvC/YqgF family)